MLEAMPPCCIDVFRILEQAEIDGDSASDVDSFVRPVLALSPLANDR
jgi:hypothetical protein